MNEKLAEALGHIDDRKIAEAAQAGRRKKRRPIWLAAVAAILAIVLLINMPFIPMSISAEAVSIAAGSLRDAYPDRDDYDTYEEFRVVLDAYDAARSRQDENVDLALSNLNGFFTDTTAAYMAGTAENRVYSPINAYIALAALAELTTGESRQQILTALNTADMQTLREQVSAIWEDSYIDNGNELCILANSLWLDKGLDYQQTAMDTLANSYHTSVYRADLGSKKADKALSAWLNNNTGGLLKGSADGAQFPEYAVLTLASTVYLQSKWSEQFSESKNTDGIFHAASGDREVTFMNKSRLESNYYWAEDYGATYLWLKNGCRMWFFLPDGDKGVEDVLADGEYLEMLIPGDDSEENSKYMFINFSVPKFDVSSGGDLKGIFMDAGITDVFDLQTADFSAITGEEMCLTSANQSARVIIDEEGVKAASYIEFPGAGAAAPPDDEIDFILDRPFVFVIADVTGIPLFTGVVNEP